MTGDRPGGLECTEVLAMLSDYVDGDLAPGPRAQVEAHLAGCDACVRFGGAFARVVQALHRSLDRGEPPPARLRERLIRALASEPGPRRGS